MLFSIILPTYNRSHRIEKAIESVINQTYNNWELIIIDDGSTDNTKNLIDSYIKEGLVDIKYFWQPNKGMHGARNLAYAKVDTEINVIIDSDDWLAENATEKIITFWNDNKSENIAGIISLNCKTNGKIDG